MAGLVPAIHAETSENEARKSPLSRPYLGWRRVDGRDKPGQPGRDALGAADFPLPPFRNVTAVTAHGAGQR